MRLLLVLIVLIFITFINAENLTPPSCKQLCDDKISCCSAPFNNEYLIKYLECDTLSCKNNKQKYLAISNNFGVGNTVTICNVVGGKMVGRRFGKQHHSSSESAAIQSVASGLSSMTSSDLASVVSAASSMASSLTTGDPYLGSENSESYIGGNGNGKFGKKQHHSSSESSLQSVSSGLSSMTSSDLASVVSAASSMASSLTTGDPYMGVESSEYFEKMGKKKHHSSVSSLVSSGEAGAAVASSLASMSSAASMMASTVGDLFSKGGKGKDYHGGEKKPLHFATCVKALIIDSSTSHKNKMEDSIIEVSQQTCQDIFGSSSCKNENNKSVVAVQSTLNDGFSSIKGSFDVTLSEFKKIIDNGNILRNQCLSKGKCSFTKIN